jgi:carbonic anhydrase
MDKRTLSQAQLDTIVATTADGGNFRRPQPANGRAVTGCNPFTTSWTWPEDEPWNTVQFSVCGTGMEQSPIDLHICDEITPSANPIVPTGWPEAASHLVYSRGLRINMPDATSQTSMRGQLYTLEQCTLHIGSEHFLDGQQEALSMNCFHTKDQVTADSPRPTGVLGFIWTIGSEADAFLTPWISAAPGAGEDDVTDATVDMTLAYVGLTLAHYWQYDGSLTTPPCSEAVDWHVLMEKRTMSRAQYESIMEKTGVEGGNFRALKPLNGRPVLGCLEGQGGQESELESDGASHAGWRVALSILVLATLSIC